MPPSSLGSVFSARGSSGIRKHLNSFTSKLVTTTIELRTQEKGEGRCVGKNVGHFIQSINVVLSFLTQELESKVSYMQDGQLLPIAIALILPPGLGKNFPIQRFH